MKNRVFDSSIFALDIFLYRNIFTGMARAATTSDAFNAVAEPRRREILEHLAVAELPVDALRPQIARLVHVRIG